MITQIGKRWGCILAGVFGISGVLAGCDTDAVAQITPDTSLGTENSVVTPNVDIQGLPADLIEGGATRGAALFHSFSEFNVGAGLRVYFANPVGIETIFSRVTGSDVSDILGTLGVDGGASLFLLNPNGIIFGENARLDIAGSFVGSTANSVVFENGVEFSATNPEAPPILTINLTPGLQYGSNSNGRITNAGTLAVGQDLTLAADNLDLQGQLEAGDNLTLTAKDTVTIRDTVANPFIATAGGQLLVQGNQLIDIFALNHPDSGLFSGGNMVLRSANTVGGDAHYWSGGSFAIEQLDGSLGGLDSPNDPVIRANQDVFLDSYTGASLHIFAGGLVFIPGTVRITAPDTTDFITEEVTLSDGITRVSIDGSVEPTLDIRAGIDWTKLGGFPGNTVEGTVFPFLGSFSPVPSADIIIGEIIVGDQGKVFLTNQYHPNTLDTPFGGITVDSISTQAGDVVFDSRGGITLDGLIDTSSFPIGSGGDVTLRAKGDIFITSSFAINTRGVAGGDVTLNSDGAISIAGSLITTDSSSPDSEVFNPSGDITVTAQSLSLTEGATLLTGSGSNINITTTDFVSLDGSSSDEAGSIINQILLEEQGNGGNIEITTRLLSITNRSGIFAATINKGNTSNITIIATDAVLIDRGSFIDNSVLLGEGNAGNIDITTSSLLVSDASLINASTQGKGNGGNVIITATDSIYLDSSRIGSVVSALGEGNGGDINITTNSLSLTNSGINASTQGKGNAGNVIINAADSVSLDGSSFIASEVTLVEAEGDGGDINITARSLSLSDGSLLRTNTSGQGDAGDVQIVATDFISFDGASGATSGVLFLGAQGDGGDINITARSLFLSDGSALSATTTAQGDAGDVQIVAADSVSFDGASSVSSGVFSGAQGDGGDINITARSLFLSDGSALSATTAARGDAGNVNIIATDSVSLDGASNMFIDSQTQIVMGGSTGIASEVFFGAQGNGGDVNITTGSLSVTNGAGISTLTTSQGNAGNIKITARDSVSFDGVANISIFADDQVLIDSLEILSRATSDVSQLAEGNGGDIDITTGSLSVTNGARVSSATDGRGDAGSIFVREADSVVLDNNSLISTQVNQGAVAQQPSNINIQTRELSLTNRSQVTARTSGQGDAGSILVGEAQDIFLSNSDISTESNSVGVAGDVTLTTEQLVLEDNSQVSAATVSSQGGGITLQGLDTLQVNNSLISASTQTGTAGKLTVNAADSVQLTGEGGLSVEATNGGTAGDLTVTTQELQVNEGAQVTVSSPQGQAGNLTIATDSIVLNQGTIFAETGISSAQGGANITLDDLNLLFLENESLISASALADANGGNVTIDSTFIIALPPTGTEGSDIIANAVQGNGGRVSVTTQGLFDIEFRPQRTPLNDITVSSEFGLDGVFVENRPDIDPNRGLTELENNFVDAERLIDRSCNAGGAALASSFIFTGRGGIPPSPLDVLESDVIVSNWVSLDEETPTQTQPESVTSNSSQSRQIIEAQGWVKLANGQIMLVAESPTVTPQVNWQNTTDCDNIPE
ncbi:MAG: filamentous hemagglutinin N-terminal domain-containing protein [Coleofasciculus sp. C1-SOL-03]|uniref:two-partner secretion domain-containing protein n=1 Tax=Coleofasciculus sp. C1-SOL-03 TaxID=3069522 RepID=UPI003300CB96